MKVYVGLNNYDDVKERLPELSYVSGFILGDLFCNYKMFKYGDSDLIDTAKSLIANGKEIIYQTPQYITDRNFSFQTSRVSYFYVKCQVRKFLVQDLGMIQWIRKSYPDAILIWSRMGRTRNSLINRPFIEFLQKSGITAIETDIAERMIELSKMGMQVYSVYGNLMYHTLSRDCYCNYLLDRFDGLCNRECHSPTIELNHKSFTMTVDGFLLGARLHYAKIERFIAETVTQSCDIMLYATDLSSSIVHLNKIQHHLQRIGD